MRVQVSGMDGSNTAGPEYGNSCHCLRPSLAVRVESELIGITDDQGLGQAKGCR
jgi:hypothetical protein